MIAPLDRPELALRISVTDRCQLRCRYCMPARGVQPCRHQDILSFEEITSFVEQLRISFDIRKVRLTGGDPLARKGIVDLVAMLSDLGIPDLAMTTNAQLLGAMAHDLHSAGLMRVNISVDSIEPDTFHRVTRRDGVEKTVEGIDAALRSNLLPVKLNMVVMQGINDKEVCNVLSFALKRGCELRFLELMPIGYSAELFESQFVPTATVRSMLTPEFELHPISRIRGSSSRRYHVKGADGSEGVVGFISPCSDRFCSDCSRLRLTADGRLMGCLARSERRDVRALLREGKGGGLAEVVREALLCKRSDSQFEQPVSMASIGG
jgi:cyclic pyranopterin phosphate synthase